MNAGAAADDIGPIAGAHSIMEDIAQSPEQARTNNILGQKLSDAATSDTYAQAQANQ